MVVSKEKIQTEILICREKNLHKTVIRNRIMNAYQISGRTFARYWNISEREYEERQKQLREALVDYNNIDLKEKFEGQIMDNLERMTTLTKIARGEILIKKLLIVNKAVVAKKVCPDYRERIAAIMELNKMDGTYKKMESDPDDDGAPIIEIMLSAENDD